MVSFSNIFNHFKTICKHKYYVFYYCRKFGITWRGVTHDLSKFHPIEFWESVKYYTKGKSPIPVCKQDKGYSLAWLHHKGRNDHHYEYWVDNLDKGGEPVMMSYDAMLEMLADWFAAGKAYNGWEFSYRDEYKWWEEHKDKMKIHPYTKEFIEELLISFKRGWLGPRGLGKFYKVFKDKYYEDGNSKIFM